MEFVEWSNNNVGFASVILSLFTLIVSMVAIVISIKTARMPFKKKLLLDAGSYAQLSNASILEKGIHITATNVGNRDINIKNIGLLIDKKVYIDPLTINESKIKLSVGELTSQYFPETHLDELKEYEASSKVYAFAVDTEGKEYKKYIDRLSKLNKLYK